MMFFLSKLCSEEYKAVIHIRLPSPPRRQKRHITADRVFTTVTKLVKQQKKLTLSAICETIKSDFGLSMSPNTIKRNELAYEIYKTHRKAPVTGQLRDSDLGHLLENTSTEAKHKMRAKISRLRRQPKDSLIAKIIQFECKVRMQTTVENTLRDEVISLTSSRQCSELIKNSSIIITFNPFNP
jgi:hypothetical protein